MQKLSIKLGNCYGIRKLEHTFDFENGNQYAIYAPNGIMKTSLAKVFSDLSKNQESKDEVFQDRVCEREIVDENSVDVKPESIFVMFPYEQQFKSNKMSTLLVNKELKARYEEIHADIDKKKLELLKELKKKSGLKLDEVEQQFSTDFTNTPKEFFKAVGRVKEEVLDVRKPMFASILYKKIFTERIVKFLMTSDFKTKLAEYIKIYNDLIDSSNFFKKGVFNHNNASTIAKNLKENGFFEANHSVYLNSSKSSKNITNEQELEEVIEFEKKSIIENDDLRSAFDEIDRQISSHNELRGFRAFLEDNQYILTELENLEILRENLWISYLKENIELFKDLESTYSQGRKEIESIIEEAKKEETQWRKVIQEFNCRFSVPFKLSIDNQDDVILKSEGPNIRFRFEDYDGSSISIEENQLFKVLSNGELRALYILNIIFEVQARIQSNQETLFIVDDIADSFDYKNKYAIIEYLKDISNQANFKQIILTHNFDFYRTVCSRLDMKRSHKLHTVKTASDVKLVQEKYQKNPFSTWRQELHQVGSEAMLIASIPFIRNIAEFSGDTTSFDNLTSLLHIKENSETITISTLEQIFKNILVDKPNLVLSNPTKSVLDLIYEVTDTIVNETSEIIDLENKIVLAIAIRLRAEKFMITKIDDDVFWKSLTKNQTFHLLKKYKELFPNDFNAIKVLQDVNLMTPENIHLNSFMYEPILDMSNDHLKRLYNDVLNLT